MINKKSLNKIAQDTYIVNQDLDYFSKQPVYNKMNDENSLLFFWSVVTKSKLFENRRKLQNKVLKSLVTLLKVYYPCIEMMLINKVRSFPYFVIMVRNSQNFSPCLNSL